MSEPAPAPGLPSRDGDAPLEALTRDQLSVFLYFSFLGPELIELMQALRISIPGYRLEKLSDVQKADAIADEVRARGDARAKVLALLRELYEFPALEAVSLSPEVAREFGFLAAEEDAPVRLLWRLLADPAAAVRAEGAAALDLLVKQLYGPVPEGGQRPPAAAKPKAAGKPDEAKVRARLERDAEKAKGALEHLEKKLDELKAQLKEARGETSEAKAAEAKERRAAERALAELEKQRARNQDLRSTSARAEVERLEAELSASADKVSLLASREERALLERDELRRALEARPVAPPAPEPVVAQAAGAEEDGPPLEEVPSTWSLPRFSREFYDSLEGWDQRIQRTAFKQAFLLAENHRHPSLRSIPLQGLPSYYRVRIATDVRLIYRRLEAEEVEVLSLIDREDLDRYIRQAKTR